MPEHPGLRVKGWMEGDSFASFDPQVTQEIVVRSPFFNLLRPLCELLKGVPCDSCQRRTLRSSSMVILRCKSSEAQLERLLALVLFVFFSMRTHRLFYKTTSLPVIARSSSDRQQTESIPRPRILLSGTTWAWRPASSYETYAAMVKE